MDSFPHSLLTTLNNPTKKDDVRDYFPAYKIEQDDLQEKRMKNNRDIL
jgi:hypothetical protein